MFVGCDCDLEICLDGFGEGRYEVGSRQWAGGGQHLQ